MSRRSRVDEDCGGRRSEAKLDEAEEEEEEEEEEGILYHSDHHVVGGRKKNEPGTCSEPSGNFPIDVDSHDGAVTETSKNRKTSVSCGGSTVVRATNSSSPVINMSEEEEKDPLEGGLRHDMENLRGSLWRRGSTAHKRSSDSGSSSSSSSSSPPLRHHSNLSSSRLVAVRQQTHDWQITKSSLCERGRHLLNTGLWSDCQFVVGLPPNVKIFQGHQMFLAMASPVFEAMFFGGLVEKDNIVKIPDVQPDAFFAMLQYIYTDNIHLTSFELVCDICYAAKKYMLPALVEQCTKYLWRDLYPRNACRAYEFARLFEESNIMDKGLQIIRTQTREILSEPTFLDVEHSTLCVILSQDNINIDESTLFEGMLRWSAKECERRGMEVCGEKKRLVLSDALFLIRYLTFTPADFAAGPAKSNLLTQEESFAILMNISAPGSWDLPHYLCKEREARQLPSELAPSQDVDLSTRYMCKRAMMQEPHCLNTSILDCSVTFTVDKDMCIHGIEVPSQVSYVPQADDLGLERQSSNPHQGMISNGNEYNELLYAHLLDADGNRLTYTHFTAKVSRNTMIEINFSRSAYIKANKIYRVGIVLNKVGWYPMGVCTRRVNCESCFFTFCVGQPTDTLRDGLIRSIIFSK